MDEQLLFFENESENELQKRHKQERKHNSIEAQHEQRISIKIKNRNTVKKLLNTSEKNKHPLANGRLVFF